MAKVAECGLTPRSSGAPPAGHQARALLWFILHRAGLASCRRRPLTSNVRRRRTERVSPSASSSSSAVGADEQQPEQSPCCRQCRTEVCMEIETARRSECRLRLQPTCRLGLPNRRSLQTQEIETHLLQSRCVRSTRGTLRETPAPPRAGSEQQTASQSAEASPSVSPGRSGRTSRTQVVPAFQQFGPPGRRNSSFVAALKAIYQRGGNCRALICREAQCIFEQVVYTGVHGDKSISQASRAPPNPSVKRSAIGRPPSPRSAVVYPALRGLGVLPPSPAYLER